MEKAIRQACLHVIFLATVLSACASTPNLIYQLPAAPAPTPDIAIQPAPALLVGLAVSGGGSRAATFAAGAMDALARLQQAPGQASVLDQVNYISSVSGGSLASAYYVLNAPPKTNVNTPSPAELSDFFKHFKVAMQEDYERPALLRQAATMRGINSSAAARSMADVWDQSIFHDFTFGMLAARERDAPTPHLVLNGTRWNDGHRFIFTTLPLREFEPSFSKGLMATLENSSKLPLEERTLLRAQLIEAYDQFRTISFENMGGPNVPGADFNALPVSLAVVASASVPGALGPVSFTIAGQPINHHIGDGGLFDNQGIESLIELFLNKLSVDDPGGVRRRALIIMIDASFPFDAAKAELDKAISPLKVLSIDPFRVQSMMEQRALAYQLALWSVLRTESASFVPDTNQLRIVHLHHTDAEWSGGYADLPPECHGEFTQDVTNEQIKARLARIPTLFRLASPCDGPLLLKAAQLVVTQQAPRITEFFSNAPNLINAGTPH